MQTTTTTISSNGAVVTTTVTNAYKANIANFDCNGPKSCDGYWVTTDCVIDLYHGASASQIIHIVDKNGVPVDLNRLAKIDISFYNEYDCEVMSTGNGIDIENLQDSYDDKPLFEINKDNFYSMTNKMFAYNNVRVLRTDSVCPDEVDAIQIGMSDESEVGQIFFNPIKYNDDIFIEIFPNNINTGKITCFVNGLPQPIMFNDKIKLINVLDECDSCIVSISSYGYEFKNTYALIDSIRFYTSAGIRNKGMLKLYYSGMDIPKIAGPLKTTMNIQFNPNDKTEKGASYTINCITLANVNTNNKNEYEYLNMEKVTDYTYKFNVDTLNYAYAKEHYEDIVEDVTPIGCSSIRKGNYYGRNLDWIYSDTADFIITTPNRLGKYATIGFGALTSKINDKFVESGEYDRVYELLPFKILDGMNEAGLVVSINMVPLQEGVTQYSVPKIETKEELYSCMIPRFVLDYFDSAMEAANYIRDYVSVKPYSELNGIHIMIGDKTKTFILEFIDGNTNILDVSDKAFMTNFHLSYVMCNADGGVYTPEDKSKDISHDAIYVNNIESYGIGLERYNLINEHYYDLNTEKDMHDLLDALKYTRMYKEDTSPRWYTELTGTKKWGDIRVNTDVEVFNNIYLYMVEMYKNRTRSEPATRQTIHSIVYDMQNKTATAIFQENGKKYKFSL